MSRLLQRHRVTEFDELQKVLCRLHESDGRTRLNVGAGVRLANSEFIRRFGGLEPFRRMPAEEQQRFAAVLSDLELGARTQEPGVAVGIGLYRIWLTDMLAGRHELTETLGEELTRLSRNAAGA